MTIRQLLAATICFIFALPPVFAQGRDGIDVETLLPGSAGESTTATYPTPFPSRGGDLDWGLALSGGGFRSAAFSIGVLKALYDTDILDDIDVISTVSGGGYASYWMFAKYDGASATRFGSGAFADEVFTNNVCHLARKSEFLPLRRMLGGLFSSDDDAFRKYREAIEWTFGPDDKSTRDQKRAAGEDPLLPFTSYNRQIAAAQAPYFIFNTTVAWDNVPKKTPNIERSFEIAPTYRGNSLLGFADWPDPANPSVRKMPGAVALSAAAIRFKLARKMTNDGNQLKGGAKIKMYDGGFSENLGALPLIQRRMKNIIIVDAENDAAYKFPSYKILQAYLKNQGTILSIAKVDGFISNKKSKKFEDASVAVGTITYPDKQTSNVFYIKMSRPKTIFGELKKGVDMDGKPLPAPKRSKTRPESCPSPEVAAVTRDSLRTGMFAYSRYLNEKWPWRYLFKALPFVNYSFPQIATVDQTYYRDQLEAFIGLGFLEASELSGELKKMEQMSSGVPGASRVPVVESSKLR